MDLKTLQNFSENSFMIEWFNNLPDSPFSKWIQLISAIVGLVIIVWGTKKILNKNSSKMKVKNSKIGGSVTGIVDSSSTDSNNKSEIGIKGSTVKGDVTGIKK